MLWWPPWQDGFYPYIWDPATNQTTPYPKLDYNIFCSGHAFLSDGKLLVAGGHSASFTGLQYTKIYDPKAGWARGLDMGPDHNYARWYPTTTTLPGGPGGDALVIAGEINSNNGGTYNNMPQVWQASGSNPSWRNLGDYGGTLNITYYPYMFVAPNGKLFMAGPVKQTRYLDTSVSSSLTGLNRWQSVATTLNNAPRNWGSAVMYAPGKVLIMGGISCPWYPNSSNPCNNLPVATAEMINLPSPSPSPTPPSTWQYAAPMTYARKLHNATLLPNGNVFVSGGGRGSESPNTVPPSLNQVLPCEMWKPPLPGTTGPGQWSLKASLPKYRGYHSIALLLPDGRVLSAGGDGGNGLNSSASAEVYTPEYLFTSSGLIPDNNRPAITGWPANGISYSTTMPTFTINTSGLTGTGTPRVTMLAPGSVTHGFNMGQRFIELKFTANSNTLTVTPPLNANLAPPGYYMLFVLNGSGVPSKAQFIKLHP